MAGHYRILNGRRRRADRRQPQIAYLNPGAARQLEILRYPTVEAQSSLRLVRIDEVFVWFAFDVRHRHVGFAVDLADRVVQRMEEKNGVKLAGGHE